MTFEQLKGPKLLNSEEHARAVLPELETRPHHRPALASKGVVECLVAADVVAAGVRKHGAS